MPRGGKREGAGRPRKPRHELSEDYRRRLECAEKREQAERELETRYKLTRAERLYVPSPPGSTGNPLADLGPLPFSKEADRAWNRWDRAHGAEARLLGWGNPLAEDLVTILGGKARDYRDLRVEQLEPFHERARQIIRARAYRAWAEEEAADSPMRCAECEGLWQRTDERWRAPPAVGDEEHEDELEMVVFCPSCAEHEFDSA